MNRIKKAAEAAVAVVAAAMSCLNVCGRTRVKKKRTRSDTHKKNLLYNLLMKKTEKYTHKHKD